MIDDIVVVNRKVLQIRNLACYVMRFYRIN